MKSVLRSGSRPAAIQSAAMSYALGTISDGVGVVAGQRVPVGDEVEAVVPVLQRRPVVQRPDQVTEVELSGRAHARNDTRLHQETCRLSMLV